MEGASGSQRQSNGGNDDEHHIQPPVTMFQRTNDATATIPTTLLSSLVGKTWPTNITTTTTAFWESYKQYARKYRMQLELADDVLCRLLFWVPHDNTSVTSENISTATGAWREVVYGVLSLHRLVLHLAHVDNDDDEDHGNNYSNNNNNNHKKKEAKLRKRNSYGMTIQTRDVPTIPATGVRVALTVIHSIMPVILAVVQATTNKVTTINNIEGKEGILRQHQRVTRLRLRLEQVKLLLRMYLMVHYWRQQLKMSSSADNNNDEDDDVDVDGHASKAPRRPIIGMLMDGGLYHPAPPEYQPRGIPWDEARSLQLRQEYVGKRTGWRIEGIRDRPKVRSLGGPNVTIAGDILHVLRPLLWALFESKCSTIPNAPPSQQKQQQDRPHSSPSSSSATWFSYPSWSQHDKNILGGWLLCLGMDMLSIRMLENTAGGYDNQKKRSFRTNPFAIEELQRRRMRLLLYALRSPFWTHVTEPLLEGTTRHILHRIPLVGRWAETALWDWILYYKHPFVAEED